MNNQVKSYTEHFRQDSKLIWAAILMVGFLTGGLTDIVEVFTPALDEIFVSEEEQAEVIKRIEALEREVFTNDSGIIKVPAGQTIPRIQKRNTDA